MKLRNDFCLSPFCKGNLLMTGGFPIQKASYPDTVPMSWRHRVNSARKPPYQHKLWLALVWCTGKYMTMNKDPSIKYMVVPCMPWKFRRMHNSHENNQNNLVLIAWKMYTLCLLFRSNANSIGRVKVWRDSEISKLHLSAQQNLLNTRLWFCHWHTKRYVEYIVLTWLHIVYQKI